MTLTEIQTVANRGSIATADFDIGKCLRQEVMREFAQKVGEADPTWLRRSSTISLTAGVQLADLPDAFRSMVVVYEAGLNSQNEPVPMTYIGEDALRVARAEITTERGAPGGYYIVQRQSDSKWKRIKFDRPADTSYTIPYVYRVDLIFADADNPELDQYMPAEIQHALIHGLRREIYFDRYGQGDPRYQRAADRFDELCLLAQGFHDHARRNYAVYSR